MKTIIEKKFDAVQYMRAQRERLSEQLLHMTKEEIIAYFKEKKVKNTVKPS
jgi:aspartate carbamoyltransferase catalytic subunit